MAFGGPRSSCVRPGAHSARRQDSRKDLTPCRMALPFVSVGAHAPHSDETPGPTATRGSSHSARRLRSLAFLCSSKDLRGFFKNHLAGVIEGILGAVTAAEPPVQLQVRVTAADRLPEPILVQARRYTGHATNKGPVSYYRATADNTKIDQPQVGVD